MRNTIDASKLDLNETIVNIRRVAKTVKGGRNMRFSVTVVVGDGDGHVGVGLGKAQEIPEAVRKATEDAKKKLITVPMVGTTIPHKKPGCIRCRKSSPDAGCSWYRRYRRFLCTYCTGSCRPERHSCEVHRL